MKKRNQRVSPSRFDGANPKLLPRPPRWADRLLEWFVAPHLLEYVQGDLQEVFEKRLQQVSPAQARREYSWAVLQCLTPFFHKPLRHGPPRGTGKSYSYHPKPARTDMLRNYFKIAWRNLVKNKAFSAINIGGLAVGMAVAISIGLWVWDELSFNQYHQNYNRIVQVLQHGTANGETWTGSSVPIPLGTELNVKYASDFKRVLKASQVDDYILAAGDDKLSLTGVFIDAEAPEMLTLHLLKGTRAGLQDLNSVLLSASAAKALFGDDDPMNEAVKINNTMDAKVTGVYEDLPPNTKFHEMKFFAPWNLYVSANPDLKQRGWADNQINVYAELEPNVDVDKLSAKIRDVKQRNLSDNKELLAYNFQIFLHPMNKWHLYSEFDKQGNNSGGMIQYVWLFSIIGAFVLLLACINFMNLSTARSQKRAKEVGIRKAVGSLRSQLIGQFFSESFLVVGLAFVVALSLVLISLNGFNSLANKKLAVLWTNPYFWLFTLGFVVITGLLAGSYPALYLSSFQPIKVLKGTFRAGRFAAIPRKVLVVVQFAVSVTLIIGTIIVYRQIQHAQNRPVGYSREGLVQVRIKGDDVHAKYDRLRQELSNTGVVFETAHSASPATEVWSANAGFDWKGKDPSLQADFGTLAVSADYGKTVGWQFVAGRDFSREYASDSSGFVVNEAAVRFMGLKNRNGGPPIGEVIRWDGKPHQIIGVIKDMVMGSPFDPIYQTVFYLGKQTNWITIKIKPNVATATALPKIEAVFKQVMPAMTFDYQFVDQQYALKFASEQRIGKLAGIFAGLAILISCLGLFGLASFIAEQRTKEIGVRKALGATVLNVWGLLSKDFLILVAIAFLIAAPVAYYFLHSWLNKYEYRTDISWWIFAVSGIGALVVTLLTVSYQTIRAALLDPVKSLRSE